MFFMRSKGALAETCPGPLLRARPLQEALRAKAFYVGDDITENTRIATKMSSGAPGQAPPDLPSLLLDGRICYIGMPVSNPSHLNPSPHRIYTIRNIS
jgi:hypothetical protein